MRIALDTNVLVYAEGVNGEERGAITIRLLKEFADEDVVIPVEVLAELFTDLTRKARWTTTAARAAVLNWYDAYPSVETSASVLLDAMELADAHRLAIWDAIMSAAAAQAGCRVLLSEDMQNGLTWRGLTVRNPFPSTS